MQNITRQILGFFLLAILLVKICLIPVIYLDFEMRRDYIIANLCENRTQPILLCNGKCYLDKQLADAKKQEEKRAENDFLSKLFSPATDISSLIPSDIFGSGREFFLLPRSKYHYLTPLISSGPLRDIFRPPSQNHI